MQHWKAQHCQAAHPLQPFQSLCSHHADFEPAFLMSSYVPPHVPLLELSVPEASQVSDTDSYANTPHLWYESSQMPNNLVFTLT